jgi:hypothetical protein
MGQFCFRVRSHNSWSKGDLNRLLDEHPNVRERYFPSPAKEDPTTPAGALAEIVEGLLAIMGFTCHERQVTAERVRLLCSTKETFTRPVLVMCKEGAIERGDAEALIDEVKAEHIRHCHRFLPHDQLQRAPGVGLEPLAMGRVGGGDRGFDPGLAFRIKRSGCTLNKGCQSMDRRHFPQGVSICERSQHRASYCLSRVR